MSIFPKNLNEERLAFIISVNVLCTVFFLHWMSVNYFCMFNDKIYVGLNEFLLIVHKGSCYVTKCAFGFEWAVQSREDQPKPFSD